MKSFENFEVEELREMIKNRFYNEYLYNIASFLLTAETDEVRMADLYHYTMDKTYSTLWTYINAFQRCGIIKTFKEGRDRKIIITAEGKEFFKKFVEFVEVAKELLKRI